MLLPVFPQQVGRMLGHAPLPAAEAQLLGAGDFIRLKAPLRVTNYILAKSVDQEHREDQHREGSALGE